MNLPDPPLQATAVRIDYTNYRGERSWRRILPISFMFAATEHHPEPQWLVVAHDLDRNAQRTFVLASIHAFETRGNQS